MTQPKAPQAHTTSGIPVHLTDFVGRNRELHDVAALVSSVRLVTLTGGGGSGKTRLAAEVAAHANAFARVVWVDLASLAEADALAQHVATTFHAPDRATTTSLRNVMDAVGDERVLLVLDNCEHLVDACAELVDALLRGCPRLTVLATSREALGVASETAWLVPPLAAEDAVRLFVDRARAALPSFTLTGASSASVREICRRLDGIPLAIELAAARARVLSAEQIAARLDDVFRLLTGGSRTALPRHRTLRATMEWSFALLAAREQVLLRRLAVFAGTFGLDAVEVVCTDASVDVDDILDGVAALVDKSLVVMDAGEGAARYRLLESVRQYGRERLAEAGEESVLERRHAEHFLSVVETATPHLVGGANSMALCGEIGREQDNLRAAVSWAVADASRSELALRFVGALFWFWYAVGQFREARLLTDRALALPAQVDPGYKGRALLTSALTDLAQGQYRRSVATFEQAIPLLREAGDLHSIAVAQAKRGAATLLGGCVEDAIPILEEALALSKQWPSHDITRVFANFWIGWAAYRQRDFARAREMLDMNASVARQHNMATSLAHSLVTLARVELALGNVEEACAAVLEGLAIEVTVSDGWGIALGLDAAAFAAARRGRYEEAARIQAATAAHRERLAVALPVLSPEQDAELNATLRAELGARFEAVAAEGRALSTEDAVAMALAEAARHTSEHRVVHAGEAPADTTRPRLRVLALGPLQVFVGDRQVDATAWGSVRPRELFVYLLMHPEGRTKEQVGLVFWPDLSAAQLRNNFHVTLHRLRKALGGAEWVSLVGDRYRVDPTLVAEFDALDFERDVREAKRDLERGTEGAAARLERALTRFRGDFLDGEPMGDWHLEHRDRLQKLYVDALMLLGARCEVEERHAKAAELYGRALARDELHEDALLALLRCYAALGERSQAIRLYRRFADRMRAELDADPGEATVRFVERLQQA
jgi:non-specific serine/threonine protein kinase